MNEKELHVSNPTNLLWINFQDYWYRFSIKNELRTNKYKL